MDNREPIMKMTRFGLSYKLWTYKRKSILRQFPKADYRRNR